MANVSIVLEADFDFDGSYETALTGYVEAPGSGLAWQRGLGPDGLYRVGQLRAGLANRGGAFTPEYTSGTFYGKLRAHVPVRVTATHSAITYTLFTGYAQAWRPRWSPGEASVCELDAADLALYLVDSEPMNIAVSTSRDTDGAIQAVLDAMGLAGGDYSLDDGVQDLPYSFAAQQQAMAAIMGFVRSEMGGLAWITAAGVFRFEARNSRLGTTVDDTWGDGTAIYPRAFSYELTDDELVTSVTVRGTRFLTGQDGEEVFRFSLGDDSPTDESLALTANVPYKRQFTLLAPVTTIEAAVSGTDYRANANADGSGTDRTSSLTVSYTLIGSNVVEVDITSTVTCYLTFCRVRGTGQPMVADRPEYTLTLPIPGQKAGNGALIDVPFAPADDNKLRDWCVQLLHTYRYEYPRLVLTFDASSDVKRVALLTVELGDLIAYNDQSLGVNGAYVNDQWYVEALKGDVPPDFAGASFPMVVTLIPSYLYRNLDAIVYDYFDRADASGDLGTSTSGHAWTNDSGMDIVSNKARPNATAVQRPFIDIGAGDVVVETAVSNLSSDTDELMGVIFRRADGSNLWAAYVSDAANQVILRKVVAGVGANAATASWTPADTAELRVIAQGSRIRVWCDRKLVIDHTDSDMSTNTQVGLQATSTTTCLHDWFYAQTLSV